MAKTSAPPLGAEGSVSVEELADDNDLDFVDPEALDDRAPLPDLPVVAPQASGQERRDAVDTANLMKRLAASKRLAARRFTVLPITGPGSISTDLQGRGHDAKGAFTPSDLVELTSSISKIGLINPVLVQQLPDGSYQLVAGERRLRALRWGAAHDPDNPHFQSVPSVVCPGPLSDADRRTWQLVENLAREDLRPGELGAALLLERCALLVPRLLAAGVSIPSEVFTQDDPVVRWQQLEEARGGAKVGAPWDEVIKALGLHLSARKARMLVAAFQSLPPAISSDMDEHAIALTARSVYAKAWAGRQEAAAELWAAVKEAGRPELLRAASAVLVDDALATPTEALERVEQAAQAANAARSVALRIHEENQADLGAIKATATDTARALGTGSDGQAGGVLPGNAAHLVPVEVIEGETVTDATDALRALLARLRSGGVLGPIDQGTVRLLAGTLLRALDGESV